MFVLFASDNPAALAARAAAWRDEASGDSRAWQVSGPHFVAKGRLASVSNLAQRDGAVMLGVARAGGLPTPIVAGPGVVQRTRLDELCEAYMARGLTAVTACHGPFGIVVVDAAHRSIAAVRDPMGVEPLYYQEAANGLYVSDRQDVMPDCRPDSAAFAAEFIATFGAPSTTTVWSGVHPVPPGGVVTWRNGRVHRQQYWSPLMFTQHGSADPDATAADFERPFRRAVLEATDVGGRTWADLSGGLDSSSVVCASAAYGPEHGRTIGGTLTFIETLGGDESRFVSAVASATCVRNERIVDPWPWQDDGEPPPVTPHPARDFPFYARDRATGALLAAAGATSLLSGIGPDCYMPFGSRHIADLVARGQMRAAAREMFAWAAIRGSSIWAVAFEDVALKFAPAALQARYVGRKTRVPAWLRRSFVDRYGYREHLSVRSVERNAPGQMGQAGIASYINVIASALQGWRHLPGIEIRHPFLDRALVELCLQAPDAVRTSLARSKPLLRAAVRQIVPEPVLRRRCTKGSVLGARFCWAFRRERPRLVHLLKHSLLADLDCIEPTALLADLDAHGDGAGQDVATLYAALSLETWLATRAGQHAPHVG